MGYKEDYIFWSMVWNLTSKYNYQLMTLTENQQEIWLENSNHKKYPIIRLMRHDIDWANWLKRDFERTILNGEQIRKRLFKKSLHVVSIYVSKFAPVDDYSFMNDTLHFRKTQVNACLLTGESLEESIKKVEQRLSIELPISIPEEIQEQDMVRLQQKALRESVKAAKDTQKVFMSGKPFFTYIFMAIQVVLFMLMEFAGGSKDSATLIEFGAKYSPYILQGEWWRFITPIVLHIGLLHLVMNTVSLFIIGAEVERIFGNFRFLMIYLFAGFTGSLASFAMNPNIAAGASGAIFGCFGALLFFGTIYRRLFLRTMGPGVLVILLFNLVYGFAVPGIDNAGHIGGLIGGYLAAGIVHFPKNRKLVKQLLFLAGTCVLTYFSLQFAFHHEKSAANSDESIASAAQGYEQKGETEKALQLLTESTKGEKPMPISNFMMGNIYTKTGDLEKAMQQYKKSLEQNKQFPEAHYNLALVYLEFDNVSEAKNHAEQAVRLDSTNDMYEKLLTEINALD